MVLKMNNKKPVYKKPSNWKKLYYFGEQTKNMSHRQVIEEINALDSEFNSRNLLLSKSTKYFLFDGTPVFKGEALDNTKQSSYQYEIHKIIRAKDKRFLYPISIELENTLYQEGSE